MQTLPKINPVPSHCWTPPEVHPAGRGRGVQRPWTLPPLSAILSRATLTVRMFPESPMLENFGWPCGSDVWVLCPRVYHCILRTPHTGYSTYKTPFRVNFSFLYIVHTCTLGRLADFWIALPLCWTVESQPDVGRTRSSSETE